MLVFRACESIPRRCIRIAGSRRQLGMKGVTNPSQLIDPLHRIAGG
jgi:hypothetical protein